MMETFKSVQQLCEEKGIAYKELAERAGLDEQRILAIILGRWTPSPTERDKVATALGATTAGAEPVAAWLIVTPPTAMAATTRTVPPAKRSGRALMVPPSPDRRARPLPAHSALSAAGKEGFLIDVSGCLLAWPNRRS